MNWKKTVAAWYLCLMPFSAYALNLGNIPPDEIAVYAQELDSGKVIESHRADASVNPASTMKLLTAFSAFEALGKDYRWKTEFKTNGHIEGDSLEGDIYWVGSGDPVFDQDGLKDALQQLQNKGIRHIKGSLVLDRHLWGTVDNPPDFESDAGSPFMTAPDPNMLAYKVVWLRPESDGAGGITVETSPPLPDIPIENKTVLSNALKCGALQNHMRANYSDGKLHIGGKVPESCLGKEMHINMLSSVEFAHKSFVNQWRALGGTISDDLKTALAPSNAKTLAVSRSKPLSDILTDMNKHSNNLIARSVFLKLGGNGDNETARRKAAEAVSLELATAGVDTENLVLENGSGLSRSERVTAHMMGQMLEKAYFSPFKQEFIDTLPIAGQDGTLKKRLKQPGSRLRLKTGTLKNVRALAGYWLGDKPMIVVVIINSPKASAYLHDLDALVSQIVLPGGNDWIDAKLTCKERMAV